MTSSDQGHPHQVIWSNAGINGDPTISLQNIDSSNPDVLYAEKGNDQYALNLVDHNGANVLIENYQLCPVVGETFARSPIVPAASCRDILMRGGRPESGNYWIKPSAYSGKPFYAYCDMETDGGGWMLVTTQRSSGGSLHNKNPTEFGVYQRGMAVDQRYNQNILKSLSLLSSKGFEVMVQENYGPDRDNGLVMVYKLDPEVPLRFDGTSVIRTSAKDLKWRTPEGYRDVK
jgi:hypothetical protein